MNKPFLLLAFLALFLPYHAFGQSRIQSDRFLVIQQEIEAWISEEKIPSMAVAVAIEGEIVWLDAFGWANKEQKIPASPQSIYALGSLSKSIAATGMMTLVESGQVGMDQSVNPLIAPARLTSYHGNSDEVKVWHILNMSAGIPHGWTTYPDEIYVPFTATEKDRFIDKIGLITFPPGKFQQYSNYSYGLLDLMMERASGKELENFLQESVFKPLAMKNTYTAYQKSRSADFVTLYSNSELIAPYHFLPYGGGGYYSTAEDLIHYGLFYLKQKKSSQKNILSKRSIDLMHNFEKGAEGMFKIGWFNTGNSLVSNGNITGANSMIMLIPSDKIAIVCLTNTHVNSYADQMADKILNLLLPDFQSEMTREKYAAIYEIPYVSDEKLLGHWAGDLQSHEGNLQVEMKFEPEGKISIQLKQGDWKAVQNPTFNRYLRLEGSFEADIPMPEKRDQTEVSCGLNLQYEEGKLYGHITSRFGYEDGTSFSYGVFLNLEKIEP